MGYVLLKRNYFQPNLDKLQKGYSTPKGEIELSGIIVEVDGRSLKLRPSVLKKLFMGSMGFGFREIQGIIIAFINKCR
jgi:hypothetical protein